MRNSLSTRPPRLIWKIAALGAKTGAVYGAALSLIFFLVVFAVGFPRTGPVLPALVGVVLVAIIGGISGLVLGMIAGLSIQVVAERSDPASDTFRWTATVGTGLTTAVTLAFLPIGSGLLETLMFKIGPTLTAAGAVYHDLPKMIDLKHAPGAGEGGRKLPSSPLRSARDEKIFGML